MPGDEHVPYAPESSAVSMTFVGWAAFSALVLLAISIGVFFAVYRLSVPTKTMPAPETFPQPRVDTHQTEELHEILAAQTKKLESWGWADQQHTLLQIPIERAMQMLAKKGSDGYAPLLPPQPALASPAAAAERAVTLGQGTHDAGPARNAPPQPEVKP